MSSLFCSLTKLLEPVTEQEFFRTYWDRQSVYIPRRTMAVYQDVLRMEDVDAFLSRGDIRYPALRMAKDGPTILPSSYSSILTFGSYASEGLVDVERVRQLYASGASIILQMTRSSIPRLSLFANRLQGDLGFNVETTVYLTPRNAQGFTTHYDTHSVFVLQIEGRKRWRLYDFMRQLPTLSDTFDTCVEQPSPVRREVVLEPGDFLYVPRGLAHDAVTESEGPSLHVSVGLFPPLWMDLFAALLVEMKEDVRFRRSPMSPLLIGTTNSSLAAEGELDSLVQVLRHSFDPRRLISSLSQQASTEMTQNNEGRLFDYLSSVERLGLETIIARRQEINCTRTVEGGRTILMFYKKALSFPNAVSPAIDCVFAREQLAVKEIQSNLTDESKLTLIRKLIKEGLVRIVSAL
jgi:ribosomal protein L16 Arg81 hydroxylase